MSFSPTRIVERVWAWIRGLPTLWTVAVAAVAAAVVGVASFYAYETYDYIEHDNDFCLSCHLMADPYERFAKSAHRDLSCKACHQPTFTTRSRMALTQIVQQPDTLATHAEVPNERCVDCHVEGDPEKWRQIASSAGHRIHFESEAPSLEGLKCVECHGTSLHQFTATSTTCQQSGCHEDTDVRLGGMSDLTIHCVACHDFSTPVARDSVPSGQDSLLAVAMRPQREECLSCHAMREQLPNMPPPEEDPHRGACGACHQPHEQATPAEAVQSCAECHARPDTLTAFHRGLQTGVLDNCTDCHTAHDFRVEGENCGACHRSLDEGAAVPPEMRVSDLPPGHPSSPTGTGRTARPTRAAGGSPGRVRPGGERAGSGPFARGGGPRAGVAGAPAVRGDADAPRSAAVHRSGGPAADASAADRPQEARPQERPAPPDTAVGYVDPSAGDTTRFRHDRHEGLDCTVCHATDRTHGRVKLTGLADCRSCHHTSEAGVACRACHRDVARAGRAYSLQRTLGFSSGDSVRRALPFEHADHDDLACGDCHRGGLARSARETSCADCHDDHHRADARCGACHRPAPSDVHPREVVHLTCGGAGCHEPAPVPATARSRQQCLACHAEMVDHRAGRSCTDCHLLPPARAASR